MWLNVTNTAICAENLKLKFWNLSQWGTSGEESADLTALCSLPPCASDSAPTTDGHPCSSAHCQHLLLQGPSDTVAAATGDDKMHLWRWKGEKCPQAKACLVPRGVLQEPWVVPRQLQPSSGLAGWWAHPVTPRSPQRCILRYSPAKLCHLKWTLTWNNNKPEKQESCMHFSLLFSNSLLIYVAPYLKESVFVYSQYEVICKNNVW